MNIHLCVITGQALANLIPLLQEKPEHVVLMYSDDMADAARQFESTLGKAGFRPEQIFRYPYLPLHPYEAISLYAMEVREDLRQKHPEACLTWNATGGTKLMALAIRDALDDSDRIIYLDTREGLLEELRPDPGAPPLNSVLTPEIYLHALGKIRRHAKSDSDFWRENAKHRRASALHFSRNIQNLESLVQLLNRSLQANVGKQCFPVSKVSRDWRKMLELLQSAGLVEWDGSHDTEISVPSADAASWLTGGWLEEYVWHVAHELGFDHVESSVKFGDLRLRKDGEDNEIDVLILHKNRLLIVECKSGYMGSNSQKDSGIIYRLDSVADQAGGQQVTKLLVSAQPLEHETRQGRKVNTRARAEAVHIHTLASEQLLQLETQLKHWGEQGRLPVV
ncbi:MAG: Card1-like endonuclease domain-containing protein [Alcanivoracaceae bacterium]